MLKRTDMDIRFGDLIDPRVNWSLYRFILDQVFERTDSLDEPSRSIAGPTAARSHDRRHHEQKYTKALRDQLHGADEMPG